MEQLLFIDIETVPQYPSFEQLPDRFKPLWLKKCNILKREDFIEAYDEKAGIYAEFGKIITIALGIIKTEEDGSEYFRVRSIASTDEIEILTEFVQILNTKFNANTLTFCAHNGKEFDFPYLSRRLLINGFQLPSPLNLSGKKPWEIKHIDTLELWKFGDYKNYTSLETLATVFDIPTSKEDIDGSSVRDAYYINGNLDQIAKYCQNDVIVTSQVYRKMRGLPIIDANNIIRVN